MKKLFKKIDWYICYWCLVLDTKWINWDYHPRNFIHKLKTGSKYITFNKEEFEEFLKKK